MKLSVSVVSHRQAQLVSQLLGDLAALDMADMEVLVTLNVPEPADALERSYPFPLTMIRNEHRKGFGANHNAAFAQARGECFAVVNPDIRLTSNPFPRLCEAALRPGTGVAAPKVLSPGGRVEDSARRFPTMGSLALKAFRQQVRPDYPLTGQLVRPDWVAGMFLVFARPAFAAVAGFDERYFLYYEDVDLCWRLRRAGYEVVLLPDVSVIHDARRESRRRPSYLRHHLAGMARFLLTRALAPGQR
jgi:GT2 family glycosyltransferase